MFDIDVFLEIGTNPEMPSLVQLRTTADVSSLEYFGEISLSLTPEKAEQLAKDILSVAKSVRELDKT